jgi:hypothetical protein
MPAYELQFTIALATCGVYSLAHYFVQSLRSRSGESGKIHLQLGDGSLDNSEKDPFNVLKPEDLLDGNPIDEQKFWKWVSTYFTPWPRPLELDRLLGESTETPPICASCRHPGHWRSSPVLDTSKPFNEPCRDSVSTIRFFAVPQRPLLAVVLAKFDIRSRLDDGSSVHSDIPRILVHRSQCAAT